MTNRNWRFWVQRELLLWLNYKDVEHTDKIILLKFKQMKNTFYILLVSLVTSNQVLSQETSTENITTIFSWEGIPESIIDIGAHPYITPPKGMIIDKNESKSYEFDKLEMYDGNTFFILDGKVERMRIIMDGDKEWQH